MHKTIEKRRQACVTEHIAIFLHIGHSFGTCSSTVERVEGVKQAHHELKELLPSGLAQESHAKGFSSPSHKTEFIVRFQMVSDWPRKSSCSKASLEPGPSWSTPAEPLFSVFASLYASSLSCLLLLLHSLSYPW